MFETTISSLAIVCSASVSAMSLFRWSRTKGYKAAIYLALSLFAGLVALVNISALLAADLSFVRTATFAYIGFATAIILPAARALANLTYETPESSETEDAPV